MGLCFSLDLGDCDICCNPCCMALGACCLIPCLCGQREPDRTVVVHHPPVVVEQAPPQYPGYPPQPGYAQPGYAQPGYPQPGFAPGYNQPGFPQPGYPPYQQPGYPGAHQMAR